MEAPAHIVQKYIMLYNQTGTVLYVELIENHAGSDISNSLWATIEEPNCRIVALFETKLESGCVLDLCYHALPQSLRQLLCWHCCYCCCLEVPPDW